MSTQHCISFRMPLDEILGHGSFGRVVRGRLESAPPHLQPGTQVAIKIITFTDKKRNDATLREAVLMTSLSHPNLVQIYYAYTPSAYSIEIGEHITCTWFRYAVLYIEIFLLSCTVWSPSFPPEHMSMWMYGVMHAYRYPLSFYRSIYRLIYQPILIHLCIYLYPSICLHPPTLRYFDLSTLVENTSSCAILQAHTSDVHFLL